jgi:hypothetical protein
MGWRGLEQAGIIAAPGVLDEKVRARWEDAEAVERRLRGGRWRGSAVYPRGRALADSASCR